MKKLFVFCSSFLVLAGIVAQDIPTNSYAPGSICSVFSKILAAVPEEFKAITSGKDQSIYAPAVIGWKKYGWKAPINFPGALVSYIEWTLFDPYKFTSFFGNEQSEEMARINLAFVKSQLTPCLSGFAAKTYDQRNPWVSDTLFGNPVEECPLVVEYAGKKAGKILPTVIQLKIKKEGSVYGVYLEVKQDEEKTTQKSEIKQPVTEKTPGDKTVFTKQLLELLDYAKDWFKTIKGEANEAMNVKNKYSGAMYFKTSIALKEAVENYIEETSSTIKFKADFGKNLTETGGRELFKDLSRKIKEGAWDDFEIKEYSGYIFGNYLRVRRKNDYTHTILLTFDDGEHDDSSPKVYITVE